MQQFILTFFVILIGCSFEFHVNSQRTTLEKQVLGSYQEIEEELVLVSSVRGAGPRARAELGSDRKKALMARMNQDFNRDDIDELKDKAIVGEANDGHVEILPQQFFDKSAVQNDIELAKKLVPEENADRLVIWKHIIAANPNLDDKDLNQVQKTFARLQRERSSAGHYVQGSDGKWAKNKGA